MTGTIPANYKDSTDYIFVEHLTNWELEEVECTYHHLREQYGILRLKCQNAPLLSQPPILQRLLIKLGYRKGNLSQGNLDPAYLKDRREERITDAFSWARDLLYVPSLRMARSDMPCANMPNAGWALYVRHGGRWGGLSALAFNEISREPVIVVVVAGLCASVTIGDWTIHINTIRQMLWIH